MPTPDRAPFQGGVHCCLSRCNSGRFFVPMRGGIPAFLLAGARCLRAALSGEAARRQRDGQRARQRAVTRSPVTRAARGQRDGQRENSAKRKTGSGQAARSSLSNRRKAKTHRHRKPAQITARKAAVNPSLLSLVRKISTFVQRCRLTRLTTRTVHVRAHVLSY